MRRQRCASPTPIDGLHAKKKRVTYDQAFKLKVVRAALERPPNNRIKPTCARFPGIEPCQLRKWIRNLEAEAGPHTTHPTYMPPAALARAPAKAEAKPKPKRVQKASHEPDNLIALATQRTPRRAAAGAVARLRVVLHEHDDLDDDDSEEESMAEATTEEGAIMEAEGDGSVMEEEDEDALNLGVSPPCTPRCADGLEGGADWTRCAARRVTSTPPSKSFGECAFDGVEIKPIYRRAASTKAGREQRSLSLGARAEHKVFPFNHGAGGSSWFLPVDGSGAPDGIDVSPQEWVDEWLSEVASEEGASE
mmetsp:Transcript_13333/g.27059  ORF Transcript_13333/g.27059 Transcript_13333/m.27059 type:complete len:307 (+) Transcript_13333:33-953(+)